MGSPLFGLVPNVRVTSPTRRGEVVAQSHRVPQATFPRSRSFRNEVVNAAFNHGSATIVQALAAEAGIIAGVHLVGKQGTPMSNATQILQTHRAGRPESGGRAAAAGL